MKTMLREEDLCKDCNGVIIHTSGESYCKVCGLVVDDFPFDDDDSVVDHDGNPVVSRTGPPVKMWESISTLL